MYTYSEEHLLFLKKRKRKKLFVLFFQVLIIISFLVAWEILARKNIINTFLFSSPSNVYKCLMDLYHKNGLFNHIWITTYETLISFALANVIGIVVGVITLIVIGIKYMVGTVQEKAEYKKTMFSYIIGLVLLISVCSFVQIIYRLTNQTIEQEGTSGAGGGGDKIITLGGWIMETK